MSLVPNFSADGLLPAGDLALTFDELRASMLVTGPGSSRPNWDADWHSAFPVVMASRAESSS